jgi:hypothetical protein
MMFRKLTAAAAVLLLAGAAHAQLTDTEQRIVFEKGSSVPLWERR